MIKLLKYIKTKLVIAKNNINEGLSWAIAITIATPTKKDNNNSILLIPAANLDGGFGEDLMVMSFIKNFAAGRPVTIYTQDLIIRDDYLAVYQDITFVSGLHYNRVNFLAALNLIKKHSLVYVIGADIMDGTYSEAIPINRLKLLQLANKLEIQTQISGFSISNNTLPSVKKKFAQVSLFMKIKSRDIESYNRLIKFVKPTRAILTNDIAFICPNLADNYGSKTFDDYVKWTTKIINSGKKIIAVCPNSLQARELGLERYILDMQALLAKFNSGKNYAFVFLYHDIRPLHGNESDLTISKALYDHFIKQNIECYYTDAIKNGVELKSYMERIEFTLTGRMHFGISGITHGKPMFGVAYANKFEGMVRLFNIDPTICLIDYDSMQESEKVVNSFLKNLEKLKSNITENLEIIKTHTYKNFQN